MNNIGTKVMEHRLETVASASILNRVDSVNETLMMDDRHPLRGQFVGDRPKGASDDSDCVAANNLLGD